jgi:hypothetical protein
MREEVRCAVCYEAVEDPERETCAECGAGRRSAQIRSECSPQGIHERLHAVVSETQTQEAACNLYLIVDPVTDVPFYVGITGYAVEVRLSCHLSDQNSAVYEWVRENGRRPRIVLVGRFPNRALARKGEESLIAFIPGLSNRDVAATRRRVKERLAS